ncbi:MAG: SDR family NAD(P)-dependent oxidoreductase [Deinococcota bacterium]
MFKARFDGQVAVVTGGASGIGKAVSQRLLQEGATVVIADRDEQVLGEAVKELEVIGSCSALPLDITNETAVQDTFDKVVREHGQLDIVLNSAGITGATATKIIDYDTATYEQVFRVNQLGSFLVTKYALNHMQARNYGRILLMASIAGKDGNPGMAGYTSTKAAVIGLVKGVGKEVAETGITVNALAPAVISTPMNLKTDPAMLKYMTDKIPMKRLGTVEETAALACWILSKEASFNTGFVFDMSGGRAVY